MKGKRASGNTSYGQTPSCLHSSSSWSEHMFVFNTGLFKACRMFEMAAQ